MTPHIPEEVSARLIGWRPFVIMGNALPPREMKTKRTPMKRKTTKRRTVPTNRRSCASRTKTRWHNLSFGECDPQRTCGALPPAASKVPTKSREHRSDLEWTAVLGGSNLSAFTGAGDEHDPHMAWCAPCFRRRAPNGVSANLARPTKW